MFNEQIKQLKENQKNMEKSINTTEIWLKKQKEELRDVKQAVTSLERIQAKYEGEETNTMEVI